MDAIEAPIPKKYLWEIKKFFEKFPKKKTVSEYTCGFKYVNPRVLIIIFFRDKLLPSKFISELLYKDLTLL